MPPAAALQPLEEDRQDFSVIFTDAPRVPRQSEVVVVTAQLTRYGCEELLGRHMAMAFDPLGEVFQRPLHLGSGRTPF